MTHGDSENDDRRTEEQAIQELIVPLEEDLQDAWWKLREFLGELGPQRIYGSPKAIMFARRICYAFVRPKKSYLEFWFFLPRTLEGYKHHKQTKVRFGNMLRLVHPDQIEEPLTDWLREAYDLVPEELAAPETSGKLEESGDEMMKKKTVKKTAAKKTPKAGPDWRPKMLAEIRKIVMGAAPGVKEELKWGDVPTWSCDGIISTGETYKNVVKMTFAKGASLKDPKKLFNSSLEGNVRRAIDFHEGDKINAAALKALVKDAIKLNQSKKK